MLQAPSLNPHDAYTSNIAPGLGQLPTVGLPNQCSHCFFFWGGPIDKTLNFKSRQPLLRKGSILEWISTFRGGTSLNAQDTKARRWFERVMGLVGKLV